MVDSLVVLWVTCLVVLVFSVGTVAGDPVVVVVLSVGLVAGGPVVVLDLTVEVVVVVSTNRKHVLQETGQLNGIHSSLEIHSPFNAQNEHKSFVSTQFSGKIGTVGSAVVLNVVLC